MTGDPRRGPGVRFPPPALFVGGFLIGLLANRVAPLPLGPPSSTARDIAGVLLVVAGIAWVVWGMWTFYRAATPIIPVAPAARIVTWGPYRFGRNPMYTGLGVAYVGLSLMFNVLWSLLILPMVYVALVVFVVRREERHLKASFGNEYSDYCSHTRRWF